MEHFAVDSQTFNDLDIFSEKSGSTSIFNLFKHTRTLAARDRLMEIMQSPSSNIEEITWRRDAIRYFHDNRITLEVKNEEIDLIEFYLRSKFKEFKNNPIDALADYITRKSSNDYYVIKTGLRYLIQLTRYIAGFIKDHNSNQPPDYLAHIFEQIKDIIDGGVLLKAIQLNEKNQ